MAAAQQPLRPLEARSEAAVDTERYTVLPANTEVVLSVNDDVTTKGGKIEEGSTFALTVASDVRLQNMVVIPRGSKAIGEIVWKTGKGAFGKSGKMEVELRFIEVGGQRIEIEGKYRQEGEGNTVATVGTVVVAGVFGALVTGKSAKIPRGRELIARTKYDIPVALPQPMTAYVPGREASTLEQTSAPVGGRFAPQSGVIDPSNVGPPKRPANTASGFCYDVQRGYAGTGSLKNPAITAARPACWQLLEKAQ
ncbi:MAG: hypothetical protein ACMVO5_00325 [Polymorphobacter sp.]|uniref:hypothetical protein n=1 Tax=Polymorphobacter sp. TaxID=1909290 RepID=UPI003A87B9BD